MISTKDPATGQIRITPTMDMLILMYVEQYRERGGPATEDLQHVCKQAGYIALYAEGINGHKVFKDTPVMGKIAEAVAVLSFLPGGITFCGTHYQNQRGLTLNL